MQEAGNNAINIFLQKKGYHYNSRAQEYIREANDWYENNAIDGFHNRVTVQGAGYELNRLGMGKRCCSDDANLCEVVDIHCSKTVGADKAIKKILKRNRFDSMFRKQLESMAATGTVACYIRLDGAVMNKRTGIITSGKISLNYAGATEFIPLTVINGEVLEAAFCGCSIENGKKFYTVVMFVMNHGKYVSETYKINDEGNELPEQTTLLQLGDVKPFSVMHVAEVNSLDDMDGYGLPKLLNAIPFLKGIDLAYNVLFGDLDKGEKLVLVDEFLCGVDEKTGAPIPPNKQMKKVFTYYSGATEKLPDSDKKFYQEYNPDIRIEQIRNTFQTLLSLLSMMFGYGTKKYTFENTQITTATEYIGNKQDQMQELNRQRYECTQYIAEIITAIKWFDNQFNGSTWNLDEDILVDYDDSFISDKESELESMRTDAQTFSDIPEFMIRYIMKRFNLEREEAVKIYNTREIEEDPEQTD